MAKLINVICPVLGKGVHYMTSAYGKRTYTNGGKTVSDFHYGIDLVGKGIATDDIIAFSDGTVTEALNNVTGSVPSQGNYVKLDHGNGIYTVYYHMRAGSVRVKKGEKIKKGAVLGYMGSSGNSTGAHLHFGIFVNGSWVDPYPYLAGEKNLFVKKVRDADELTAVNKLRGTDEMILYLNKKSTGTNKWGAEVCIDRRGVAVEWPVYGKGNMNIPEGGKVLSGHGKAAEWIIQNISAGDLLWFVDNRINIAKGCHRSVLFNCIREKDTLVVYNEGAAAKTNKYGYEVAVDRKGVCLNTPVYGKGRTNIPAGGFVLSGHGKEGRWLLANVKKGKKIVLDKAQGFIKVV